MTTAQISYFMNLPDITYYIVSFGPELDDPKNVGLDEYTLLDMLYEQCVGFLTNYGNARPIKFSCRIFEKVGHDKIGVFKNIEEIRKIIEDRDWGEQIYLLFEKKDDGQYRCFQVNSGQLEDDLDPYYDILLPEIL